MLKYKALFTVRKYISSDNIYGPCSFWPMNQLIIEKNIAELSEIQLISSSNLMPPPF